MQGKDFESMLNQIRLTMEHKKEGDFNTHSKKSTKWENILEIDTEEGSAFPEFIERLFTRPMRIVILGGNETGKTSLGFNILENISFQSKRKCYALGYPRELLPKFIHRIIEPSFVPVDSAELVDEAGMFFNSRLNGGKRRVRSSNLFQTARQQGDTLISITQNSAKIDIDLLRFCDVIMLKELGMMQTMFERKSLGRLFDLSQECFNKIPKEERVKYTFVFCDQYQGFVKTELPTFWNTRLSNGFRSNLYA